MPCHARPGERKNRSKADEPVSVCAKRLIRKQLKAVCRYAPRAAKNWQDDTEYVHQFRVATRRARTALLLFPDLLPPDELRWVGRRLREFRRAAGRARDLDVLAERLKHAALERKDCQLDDVVQQILARRRKAQKPLKATYRKAKRSGFEKRSRDLAREARWRSDESEPTFADAACARLGPYVDAFFAAAVDLSTIPSLHQMRIAGKRVRYAMELLSGAFSATVRRQLQADFTEVQDRLGAINDLANAIGTFMRLHQQTENKRHRAELIKLVHAEQARLIVMRDEFHAWWDAERSGRLAAQFAVLLGRDAPGSG